MTRFLLLAMLALGSRTAAAQTADDFSDATPDAVLAQAWSDALYGAEAVAGALDDVAADTAGAAPEALGEANRGRALATVAAAASSASISLSLQFSIALADPSERASVYAALAEDALGLNNLLLLVAETVDPPPADSALMTARAQHPDGSPAGDIQPEVEDWAARAAQIREAVGRLRGATAALGITAP